jgi:hypothetical protein
MEGQKCQHCGDQVRSGYHTCGASFCQELDYLHHKARNTRSKKTKKETYSEIAAIMASRIR